MFKLELIELLFHLFKIICESSSCIIMLLLKHFSFLNKLVFHIIYSLLEFFSTNDRLSILGLQAFKKWFICNPVLFKFLLLFIKLELREFKSLFENSFFFSPILFGHIESFFGIFQLSFELNNSILIEFWLLLLSLFHINTFFVILLLKRF